MPFFAGAFLAVDFFAGDVFFAAALVAVFFAAEDLLVALVAVFFAGEDFFAVDLVAAFFAPDVYFAVDFVVLFFAADDLLAALLAVFLAGADFVAVDLDAAAVFLVAPRPAGAAFPAEARVSFGSFFAPETTALSSAPALNLGTAVFLALIRSPVRGLRTQRASRTFFSNDPKPVIATFSPLATSRVMVSSTDSSACAACLRLPS